MSREIKFRVFVENEMLYSDGKYREFKNNLTNIDFINKRIEIENRNFTDYYSFETVHIMQYTGLKDCNGKEIFEGDILYDSHLDEKYVVNFFEGSYVMEETEAGTTSEIDTDTEIVGNIYENPELLGEINA